MSLMNVIDIRSITPPILRVQHSILFWTKIKDYKRGQHIKGNLYYWKDLSTGKLVSDSFAEKLQKELEYF